VPSRSENNQANQTSDSIPSSSYFAAQYLIQATDSYVEDGPSSSAQSSSHLPSSTPKPAASRKTPARKIGVQATRLETVDGSHDPLGPLGGDVPFPAGPVALEQAPTPPRKELAQNRSVRPSSAASQASFGRGSLDSPDRTSDNGLPLRQKGPPPVQPPAGGPISRQTQPSMSIEQAAKPSFDITVGDPHKVGDITSSHIVYQVQTRVSVKMLIQAGKMSN
jgi:sorting nexin-1/2